MLGNIGIITQKSIENRLSIDLISFHILDFLDEGLDPKLISRDRPGFFEKPLFDNGSVAQKMPFLVPRPTHRIDIHAPRSRPTFAIFLRSFPSQEGPFEQISTGDFRLFGEDSYY